MSITEEPAEAADEKAEDDTPVAEGQVPWAGSDRDYTYEEVSFSSGKPNCKLTTHIISYSTSLQKNLHFCGFLLRDKVGWKNIHSVAQQ